MNADAPAGPLLVSVVIPAYNYGHLLSRAIDSVHAQSRPDCELLVIDDGSTDDTPRLLERLQATAPAGLRWVRQENAGAGAARNRGLRLSRGDYLLFLDADDELLPGALDAVCETIRANPRASVILGGRVTRRADGRERYHPPPAALNSDPAARVADYLLRKKIGMGHGSTVASRALLAQRPYPEGLRGSEDIPVFAHLFACGEFATTERPLVRIHKHRDSLRHIGQVSDERATRLVDEVFRGLPASCAGIRGPYAARRYLSLFRIALRSGDARSARRYLGQAAGQDLRQVLRPDQFRKSLKAALSFLLGRG